MERRDGTRLCRAARQLSPESKIPGSLSHSRRAARLLRQRLELSLESASLVGYGIRRGNGGFSRLERLWRGVWEVHHRPLGRSAAHRSTERLELCARSLWFLGRRSGLRAGRFLRRLHGRLDRGELDKTLEVLGES